MGEEIHLACFILPHGFGHAARAASLMSDMHEMNPHIRWNIFTLVHSWFFRDSFSFSFDYHSLLTDIGLVQTNPLEEDMAETLKALDDFLPFSADHIKVLAEKIKKQQCRAILCDISPLGIAVAHAAGIPAILVENFTWDWIYQGYASAYPEIEKHSDYLGEIFASADFHIQTEPVCLPGDADLTVPPLSRKIRMSRSRVRQKLGISDTCRTIMITMGGIPDKPVFLEALRGIKDVFFIVPCGSSTLCLRDNLILLPYHSDFFHPDLINASDAVIGKIGYSTLAEVHQAGIPFGYITRARFCESVVLSAYVEKHMQGKAISEKDFQRGGWIDIIPGLLEMPRLGAGKHDGVRKAAEFILRCACGRF